MRIVFLGTPDFAVASLKALFEAGNNIVGVVTAPDKPSGRGLKITESAVKKYSLEQGFNILQPEKLKSPEFLQQLENLNAEIQVVVAFRMLPEKVWNMPAEGTVNLHGSFLPAYRGAAPINWAIINGEVETGVTTFRLKQEIDTGDILLREKIRIGENETAGELHDRMKEIGAALLVKTIAGIQNGTLADIPQTELEKTEGIEATHAPKIFTETCRINWNNSVEQVHNLVRGLSPYPSAFTSLDGKMFKIFRSEKEYFSSPAEPGSYITDQTSYLKFACADGYLHCKDVQLEGKKRIPIEDFLRGYRFP